MADRRMFSKGIICSDAFRDMSQSAQCLYVQICMNADDDGFFNGANGIVRSLGLAADDLRELITRGFLIMFESGIVLVKHWKINNYIQKDRYHETKYDEEKSLVELKKNGAYTIIDDDLRLYQREYAQKDLQANELFSDKSEVAVKEEKPHKNEVKQREKDAEELFERLWQLIINKKGKGQVSKKSKLNALKIGYDAYAAMIERFNADMTGRDMQYVPHGSTFFNSGYVDYMDAAGAEHTPHEEEDKYANYQ